LSVSSGFVNILHSLRERKRGIEEEGKHVKNVAEGRGNVFRAYMNNHKKEDKIPIGNDLVAILASFAL